MAPIPSRRPPLRSPARRVALLVALVVVAVSGCQAKVEVDTVVAEDGSGTVTVALGLDPQALARLGDPDATVQVADLRAAGWEIPPADKDADGTTWLRATKAFATTDEASQVMAELHPEVFRDFRLQRETGFGHTTWTWTGTVDLSRGVAVVGDPEVAAAVGGDPFGGRVADVERAEGKPVAEMVDVTVAAQLPDGVRHEWHPRLGDSAVPVQASATRTFALPVPAGEGVGSLVVVGAGAALALLAVVVWRRRSRRAGAR
ncbi:MAG: hypothetical protein R2726_07720 [Acidimicrobiales bacterium]